MDIFIARQPIFDKNMKVFGYELLYREGQIDSYVSEDGEIASSNVMLNSFHVIGINNLTGGKKAFINFTASLLKQGVATLFPKEQLVVEVLETVRPEKEILESCLELKKKGYIIALDDFVRQKEYLPLIEYVDIIKVDFLKTTADEKKEIVRNLGNGRIRFLAEKIETHDDFKAAKSWGYSLFQGYFFEKPSILSVQDIQPYKFNYLKLIQLVNLPELDFEKISNIITQDVSLSYKLLRLVNSAAFGFKSRITSVKQVLVFLGTLEIKKWVSLIALKGIGDENLDEIVRISLVRAKFFELLASYLELEDSKEQLFLMGLFSALDILMNRPMPEILKEISVCEQIYGALINKEGGFGLAYKLILAYEKADWELVTVLLENLEIEQTLITKAYLEAVTWCNQLEEDTCLA